MEVDKIVALVEVVALDAKTIVFQNELSLVPDKELFMALITRRECGFPNELSPEAMDKMYAKISKSRLHSWIRLFGLQLAYDDYCSRGDSNVEIKQSIASAIDALAEVRVDPKFQSVHIPEPRLIFWLEDVG